MSTGTGDAAWVATTTDHTRSLALAVAWLAYFTALQWSLVRFSLLIVAVLTLSTVALGVWQWRRIRVLLTPPAVAVMLVGSAIATVAVSLFSYLEGTPLVVAKSGPRGRSAAGRGSALVRPAGPDPSRPGGHRRGVPRRGRRGRPR